MGVTIKDVAKAAGVSVTSTSYALNNSGHVSEEKKQRIFAAARKLGYVPSGVAKSLQSKKMGFVGYFAYSLSGPMFGELIKGVEDVFNYYHQDMVACCCAPEIKKVTRLLKEKMVDGAIVFVEHIENELLELIASEDCPIVVMDRELTGKHISSILIDNQGSAYNVGRYISKQKFKSVGCIVGKGYDGAEREKGFRRAVRDYGLNLQENCILEGHFQAKTAYSVMKQWLEDKTHTLPEVIFAFSDQMAIAAIQAIQECGYRVPEDVSIIGMDDIPAASYINIPLTTVHRPIYELGQQAAMTLYDMMQNKSEGKLQILPTYLVERKSCMTRGGKEKICNLKEADIKHEQFDPRAFW